MMTSANQSTEGLAYAAPTLTVYGSVAELTAGGTGTSCETSGRNGCVKVTGGNPRKQRG